MKICFEIEGADDTSPLNKILNNQIKIMALIDELKTKITGLEGQVTELQTTVNEEQTQIAALLESNAQVVTNLNTQIATLTAQVAAGATPEQIQEVINSITTIAEGIATTKTDIEGTV